MSRLSRIIGVIIVLISLYFVGGKIWSNRLWLVDGWFTKQIIIVITFASAIYALNGFILSTSWKRLLAWFGCKDGSSRDIYSIYARTQIAKYIPGNIFHFTGRHVLGNQLGFGHGQLAGAAIYEIVGLLVASSAIALAGTGIYGLDHIQVPTGRLFIIFILTLLISLFSSKVVEKLPKFKRLNLQNKRMSEVVTALMPVYFLYVIFFLITGIILCWVTNTISHIDNLHQTGYVITTLAVSWIAGFITPGASGGIGVREAIIVVLLKNIYGEPASILIALIFRLITVLGDVFFFVSSFAIKTRI